MPSVTLVVVCHDRPEILEAKYAEVQRWTRQPDEVIVMFTGKSGVLSDKVPWRQIPDENRDDKGDRKRTIAGGLATKDWILFINYDANHEPHILERSMQEATGDTDVICFLAKCGGRVVGRQLVRSQAGVENVIVRRDLYGRIGGYKPSRPSVRADYVYVEDLGRHGKVVFVEDVLMTMR